MRKEVKVKKCIFKRRERRKRLDERWKIMLSFKEA